MTRAFPLIDVLRMVTGKVILQPYSEPEELFRFLLGRMPSHLHTGRLECRALLLAAHPELQNLDVSSLRTSQEYSEWYAKQVEHFGPTFTVQKVETGDQVV